jgi:hypothetical protein
MSGIRAPPLLDRSVNLATEPVACELGLGRRPPVPSHAMRTSARVAAVLAGLWTAYVWTTRIVNAAGDTQISDTTRTLAYLLSASMLVLAAGAVGSVFTGRALTLVRVFVGWTVAVWAVRIPQILLAEHPVGFKVVHAALGLLSIGLAAWLYRSVFSSTREPVGTVA